jgi:hypothetical protein
VSKIINVNIMRRGTSIGDHLYVSVTIDGVEFTVTGDSAVVHIDKCLQSNRFDVNWGECQLGTLPIPGAE